MPRAELLTAGQAAELVGGELLGAADTPIAGVAPLDRASPQDLSYLASSSYLTQYESTRAGVVLVAPPFRDVPSAVRTRIVVAEPRAALSSMMARLFPEPSTAWGIHSTARVAPGVRWAGRLALGAFTTIGPGTRLGRDCHVGEGTHLGAQVRVGNECRIGPNVMVGPGTEIGDRVVLHAGTRIGTTGFAFHRSEGNYERLTHAGGCVIGDNVEIGANVTVDGGTMTATRIGAGTKIDNLVHVAHNVQIGKRCLIMAQVGIAGSTVIEDDVVIAGQAGLADHVHVKHGARIAAQAGVIGTIKAGATVSGYPARDHAAVLRQTAALAKLAPLVTALERLAEQSRG